MEDNELKQLWSQSTSNVEIKVDVTTLVVEFETKITKMGQVIKTRDTREYAASLFGMVVFAYFLIEIPFPLTKIASGLAIIWFGYVVFKINKTKKLSSRVGAELPVLAQLQLEKSALLEQKNLLKTAAFWYVIPPFLMNLLWITGLGSPVDYQWETWASAYLPISTNTKLFCVLGLAVFYGFTIWINLYAAKHKFEPLIKKTEILEAHLGSIEQEK